MNYIAHAIFSDVSGIHHVPDRIISDNFLFGALLADAFKRQQSSMAILSKASRDGIKAHTDLDFYFDTLPPLKKCRTLFNRIAGSYSGVVIDICYDHSIAKNWNDLFQTPFDLFVNEINDIMYQRISLLPMEKQDRARHMLNEKWLSNYKTTEGLIDAIQRVSRRTKENRGERITSNIDKILFFSKLTEPTFLSAIPLLKDHCERYITDELAYDPTCRLKWKTDFVVTPEGQPDTYRK